MKVLLCLSDLALREVVALNKISTYRNGYFNFILDIAIDISLPIKRKQRYRTHKLKGDLEGLLSSAIVANTPYSSRRDGYYGFRILWSVVYTHQFDILDDFGLGDYRSKIESFGDVDAVVYIHRACYNYHPNAQFPSIVEWVAAGGGVDSNILDSF